MLSFHFAKINLSTKTWFGPTSNVHKNKVKTSWGFCDILSYSLWSPHMWYTLMLPKILLQWTGAEGLYYKTKKERCHEVT